MKKIIQITLIVVVILVILGIIIWAEIYHYQDCLRVGHTKLYCLLDIFRGN